MSLAVDDLPEPAVAETRDVETRDADTRDADESSARQADTSRRRAIVLAVLRRLPRALLNLLLAAIVIALALLTWAPVWFGAPGR